MDFRGGWFTSWISLGPQDQLPGACDYSNIQFLLDHLGSSERYQICRVGLGL